MFRSALRFSGFDVDIATDGVSALSQIEQQRPDLIVLDLLLPRLRGEAILAELADDPHLREIPVVICTGTDVRLSVAQATAILRKPCAPDVLVAVVEQQLPAA